MRPELLAAARARIDIFSHPLQRLASTPVTIWHELQTKLLDRHALLQENEMLREALMMTRGRLHILESLDQENRQLLRLVQDGYEYKPQTMLPARVQNTSTLASQHWLQIDRGRSDGLATGMAAIDGHGVMGQLSNVSQNNARLLLITDSRHAIATYVERNGIRAIAEGNGSEHLLLRHITQTTDIQVGDDLLSSGLGGRFPRGYPVAVVSLIRHSKAHPFVYVQAIPTAHLWRSRQLLLLAPEESP